MPPPSPSPTPDPVRCSAKGCHDTARWAVVWNNPRLHDPGREKRWVACPEHREHLAGFLAARGFLRRVDPLPESGPPGGS